MSRTVKAGIQSPKGRIARYLKKSRYAIVASLLEASVTTKLVNTMRECVDQIEGDLAEVKTGLDQFTSKVKQILKTNSSGLETSHK